jgi:hypothetical protein
MVKNVCHINITENTIRIRPKCQAGPVDIVVPLILLKLQVTGVSRDCYTQGLIPTYSLMAIVANLPTHAFEALPCDDRYHD